MRIFSFEAGEECRGLPVRTDFVWSWANLARKSGYCRHRLAKFVQVSTRTLDRYFEKHRSLSVQQWLSELQLVDAYHQVTAGKLLKEISFNLGFKQPSHFTRRFKARFGIVPSALLGSRALGMFTTANPFDELCGTLRAQASVTKQGDRGLLSYAA